MRWGSGWNRFCRERQQTPAGRRTTASFWRRCCGVSARDRRHEPMRAGSSRVLWEREPCRPALSSVPLSGGCRRGFLSVVSTCYPTHSIGRSYRWMARSCKPMPRLPGRKKELLRRHRTFKSIHDGVQPPKSTFLRLFCVFWTLFQSYPRVIRNGKDGIAAEPGLTDRVRTPKSVTRGRARHTPGTQTPVSGVRFSQPRCSRSRAWMRTILLRITATGTIGKGDLVRLAAVPQALVEGDHVGVVKRCREGGPVEHGAGSVAAAPDMSGSLELSAAGHCRRRRGRHRSGPRSSGGSGTPVRPSGTGSGDQGGGGDQPHARHRCENGKRSRPGVGFPDPALDRRRQRVDRRVQWGKHHRDGRLDFGVEVPLRVGEL